MSTRLAFQSRRKIHFRKVLRWSPVLFGALALGWAVVTYFYPQWQVVPLFRSRTPSSRRSGQAVVRVSVLTTTGTPIRAVIVGPYEPDVCTDHKGLATVPASWIGAFISVRCARTMRELKRCRFVPGEGGDFRVEVEDEVLQD